MGTTGYTPWVSLYREFFWQSLGDEDGSDAPSNDVRFVCAGGEVVSWNGLPYLATLSSLFRGKVASAARITGAATVHMPEFSASAVTKLVLLLTQGSVNVGTGDVDELRQVMRAVGVRVI